MQGDNTYGGIPERRDERHWCSAAPVQWRRRSHSPTKMACSPQVTDCTYRIGIIHRRLDTSRGVPGRQHMKEFGHWG